MVDACTANGFTEEHYGVNFWKQLQSKYTKAFTEAGSTSGDVSGYVGEFKYASPCVAQYLIIARSQLSRYV